MRSATTYQEWLEATEDFVLGGYRVEVGSMLLMLPWVIHRDPRFYDDPDAFRPHMHHWIELARMRENPHPSPIRETPTLYNIYDHRSEGLATGVARQAGVTANDILDVCVVGNPIMHHLLLGVNPVELGGAPFALATDEAVRLRASDIELALHPAARCDRSSCVARDGR